MKEWRYSSEYPYPLHWMQVNTQLYPLSSGGEEQLWLSLLGIEPWFLGYTAYSPLLVWISNLSSLNIPWWPGWVTVSGQLLETQTVNWQPGIIPDCVTGQWGPVLVYQTLTRSRHSYWHVPTYVCVPMFCWRYCCILLFWETVPISF
jgi:hypothetical protein